MEDLTLTARIGIALALVLITVPVVLTVVPAAVSGPCFHWFDHPATSIGVAFCVVGYGIGSFIWTLGVVALLLATVGAVGCGIVVGARWVIRG